MTVVSSRDFLFCPLTGTLLELDAASGLAKCPVCKWTKSLAGMICRSNSVIAGSEAGPFKLSCRRNLTAATELEETTTTTSKIDMEVRWLWVCGCALF